MVFWRTILKYQTFLLYTFLLLKICYNHAVSKTSLIVVFWHRLKSGYNLNCENTPPPSGEIIAPWQGVFYSRTGKKILQSLHSKGGIGIFKRGYFEGYQLIRTPIRLLLLEMALHLDYVRCKSKGRSRNLNWVP